MAAEAFIARFVDVEFSAYVDFYQLLVDYMNEFRVHFVLMNSSRSTNTCIRFKRLTYQCVRATSKRASTSKGLRKVYLKTTGCPARFCVSGRTGKLRIGTYCLEHNHILGDCADRRLNMDEFQSVVPLLESDISNRGIVQFVAEKFTKSMLSKDIYSLKMRYRETLEKRRKNAARKELYSKGASASVPQRPPIPEPPPVEPKFSSRGRLITPSSRMVLSSNAAVGGTHTKQINSLSPKDTPNTSPPIDVDAYSDSAPDDEDYVPSHESAEEQDDDGSSGVSDHSSPRPSSPLTTPSRDHAECAPTRYHDRLDVSLICPAPPIAVPDEVPSMVAPLPSTHITHTSPVSTQSDTIPLKVTILENGVPVLRPVVLVPSCADTSTAEPMMVAVPSITDTPILVRPLTSTCSISQPLIPVCIPQYIPLPQIAATHSIGDRSSAVVTRPTSATVKPKSRMTPKQQPKRLSKRASNLYVTDKARFRSDFAAPIMTWSSCTCASYKPGEVCTYCRMFNAMGIAMSRSPELMSERAVRQMSFLKQALYMLSTTDNCTVERVHRVHDDIVHKRVTRSTDPIQPTPVTTISSFASVQSPASKRKCPVLSTRPPTTPFIAIPPVTGKSHSTSILLPLHRQYTTTSSTSVIVTPITTTQSSYQPIVSDVAKPQSSLPSTPSTSPCHEEDSDDGPPTDAFIELITNRIPLPIDVDAQSNPDDEIFKIPSPMEPCSPTASSQRKSIQISTLPNSGIPMMNSLPVVSRVSTSHVYIPRPTRPILPAPTPMSGYKLTPSVRIPPMCKPENECLLPIIRPTLSTVPPTVPLVARAVLIRHVSALIKPFFNTAVSQKDVNGGFMIRKLLDTSIANRTTLFRLFGFYDWEWNKPVEISDYVRQTCWTLFHEQFNTNLTLMVRFAKRIPGFAVLRADDRITLVRNGAFEVGFLLHYMYWNTEFGTWHGPDHAVLTLDQLTSIFPTGMNFFRLGFINACALEKLAQSLDHLGLLAALLIFNPDIPELVDKKAVRFLSDLFTEALIPQLPTKKYNTIKLHDEVKTLRQMGKEHVRFLNSLLNEEVFEFPDDLYAELFNLLPET